MSSFRLNFSPGFLLSLVLLAALAHGFLALLAMREKSTTVDELAHVTGGYTFNRWNDYRMHPENGLLPQRWQALPVTLAGARYPAFTSEDWRRADVWLTGYHFFYSLGNNHEWILWTARAMNTLFGIATVLLVAAWARYFFGWPGAFTTVIFTALCPTMLAHTALATSDMAMCFFLLASVSAYWWHLHDGRTGVLLLSSTIFGLACVAKYTAVLLLPLFLLMALIRSANGSPLQLSGRTFHTRPGRLGIIALTTLAHGLGAVVAIWAFSGFRYSAFNPSLPPGEFNLTWEYALSFGGWKAQIIQCCRDWRLLPEGYLYGFAFVLRFAEARGAFLDGGYSIFGWISFFPKTFLYKTPLSLLVGLGASASLLLLWVRQKGLGCFGAQLYRAAPLWLLFAVYWGFSLTSHLNIGHRHILPTYPILYIFCGLLGWAAWRAWQHSRSSGLMAVIALAALLGWHTAIAVGIHPHYLAYFSPIIGGPQAGYKHLVDSSLDWGQDLPGLKTWLDARQEPGEPLYLSYFGTGEPEYYGIRAVRMPQLPRFGQTRPWYWPAPGLYALSATMLQHVYMSQRGPWTAENERLYQKLRRFDAEFRRIAADRERNSDLARTLTPAQWDTAWDSYERLRFARLCHYLRARRPDAMIGYSILIFRLSQAEIDAALNGPASALAAAITHGLNAP